MSAFYELSAKTIDGEEQSMGDYQGKVLLIVNTASKCGFTPQYTGLEALYEQYSEQGLVVLGFPCNQFGKQEPGDAEEIKNFCSLTYDVKFPMFSKIDVNGDNTHPIYQHLKAAQKGFITDGIKWNFTKFLVNREGEVVGRYAPKDKPEDLKADIEKLL